MKQNLGFAFAYNALGVPLRITVKRATINCFKKATCFYHKVATSNLSDSQAKISNLRVILTFIVFSITTKIKNFLAQLVHMFILLY